MSINTYKNPYRSNSMETKSLKRPPSYSDSFFFLPEASEPLIQLSTIQPTVQDEQPLVQPLVLVHTFTTCEKWTTRTLSLSFHIFLISLFETLFFFLFVSKSEDAGIQSVVESYVSSTLSTCGQWPPNTTEAVNDVLVQFMNATDIQEQGLQATTDRMESNLRLQYVAWLYVCGLASLFTTGSILCCICRGRIAWKRIVIENCIMIVLLGLYELMFFKTIIYRYQNKSPPELDAYIVNQLQTVCSLL